ncbi:uncharacterized protein JNUCC1_03797 [Lentibacillus sp. JNUCC-1]|uniref:hypothetical protein n=1 Tax=Lentibacillus sp. JNUCC-1 TaxID=2654513 RepID=UPI001323B694|nr:uncharacterized protein [Lentibacillus sp. JNUCC-1]
MYRFKGVIHMIVFILIVFISFEGQSYNPFTTAHLNQLPYEADVAMKENNPLYEEIIHKAKNYEQEPENAYIDKVWKKTPGRNGIKVDVDASYEQMNKNGVFDTSLFVYEQIPQRLLSKTCRQRLYTAGILKKIWLVC